jgi:ribosomal peptide maturation radical SAM protein 1
MTFKIRMLTMPFAAYNRPSIALTQLKYVVEEEFGDRVDIENCYATHIFAEILGRRRYAYIADSSVSPTTGLGDWLFQSFAFPDRPSDPKAYLARNRRQFAPEISDWLASGYESILGDIDRGIDRVIERYGLESSDLVGFSSTFSQTAASIAVARRLKQSRAGIATVMGGANCEGTMGVELAANVDVLDYVCSGYALKSFPELVDRLSSGDVEGTHRIDGVLTGKNVRSVHDLSAPPAGGDYSRIKADDLVVGIAPMGTEKDINEPISLDYDDYFDSCMEVFGELLDDTVLHFETSRGCWWGARSHCTFCGLNGSTMAYKAMRPDLAIHTIRALTEKYSGRAVAFSAVDNIVPKEYFEEVFPNISPPGGDALYFYEVKADLSREQIAILAKSGVMEIQPGIESLATSTLKLMRKGTTAFHNISLLRNCLAYGVKASWNLLIGFPGEPPEVYEQYLKILPLLQHLPPPTGVFPVRFDRFSPYYNKQMEYGLKLQPYSYYRHLFPFPPDVLMNMAYYFQDTNYDAEYMGATAQAIGPLNQLVDEWAMSWMDGPSKAPKLAVQESDGGMVIHDTRMGRDRSIPVSSRHLELLRELAQPKDESAVRRDAGDAAIDFFDEKELLFRERGRICSLVHVPDELDRSEAKANELAEAL